MEKSARTPDPLNNSENNTKKKSEGKFRNVPFLKIAWPVLIIIFSCMVYMGYSFISSFRPGGERYIDYAAKFDSLSVIQNDTIAVGSIRDLATDPESGLSGEIASSESGVETIEAMEIEKPVVGLGQKFRFILALLLIFVVPLSAIISIGLTKFKKGYGNFWTACVIMLPLIGSLLYFTLGRSQRIKPV